MSEAPRQVAIQVTLPPRQQSKLQREREAFFRLLPQLLATHHGQYVAIHEGQVIASGSARLEIAQRVWASIGNVDVFIGLVSEETRPIVRSGIIRVLQG